MKTVDSHVAGEPLRLVVEGCPGPAGATMRDKREWVSSRCDWLRRALMYEPRGHADMCGAVLTEPVDSDSHAGVPFMHSEGFGAMGGHGVIGVMTIAIERGLLHLPDASDIRLDTPEGTVSVAATRREFRVGVSYVGMPSFVMTPGMALRLGSRELRVDVAFGGAFYAIVDSESAGVPELRTLGLRIRDEVNSLVTVAHPEVSQIRGVHGTIFTGLPNAEAADLRNVTVFANGQVDWSPCGTGTAAVMAVLDAMGLLPPGRPFIHKSIIGTQCIGTVDSHTSIGETPAIGARIEESRGARVPDRRQRSTA